MKRLIIVIFALLLLSSCQQAQESKLQNKYEFSIDGGLYDIGEFSGSKKTERFYDDYTPNFIPSDEYGEINPFVGETKIFTIDDDWFEQLNENTYGFCTPDGKIVMDAAENNTSIAYRETTDGFGYYVLSQDVEETGEEHAGDHSHMSYIIPVSGKWVIECGNNFSGIPDQQTGYIYLSKYSVNGQYIDVYDYDGNYVKTINEMERPEAYSHGLKRVSARAEEGYEVYFVNEKQEKVLGPYKSAAPFNKYGISNVCDKYWHCYLIDTDGKKLTKPYDSITDLYDYKKYRDDDDKKLFSARNLTKGDLHDVYTSKGEYVKTISADMYFSARYPESGEIIYYSKDYTENNDDGEYVWKRLSDDSDFVSKEFGVMPNSRAGNDNCYVYIDNIKGGGFVFDGNGETLAKLSDMQEFYECSADGKYIFYRDGATEKEINERVVDGINLRNTHFGNTHIYSIQKQEVVYTVPTTTKVTAIGKDDRYILIRAINYTNSYSLQSDMWLFDALNGKILFENVDEIKDYTIDDKVYFNVSTDSSTTLYDENLNVILKNYHD